MEVYHFHKANYADICVTLNSVQWESRLGGKNVEQKWEIVKSEMYGSMLNSVPKREIKGKKFPSWMKVKLKKD